MNSSLAASALGVGGHGQVFAGFRPEHVAVGNGF